VFTYRWREDGSDADLLPGDPVTETFTVAGQEWTWEFPGRNECSLCHTDAAGTVLGVKARHLNSSLTYPGTGRTANQLVTLNRLGFFTPSIDESRLPDILTSVHIGDEGASLERRARSYLDINCAHCHQPNATTQAVFDARLETPPYYQNVINVVPNDALGITGARLVKPGDAPLSVLHRRVGSLQEGVEMPPLAKNVVDAEAITLLTRWIESLDPATAPTGPVTDPAPRDFLAPDLTLAFPGQASTVEGPFTVNLSATEPIIGLAPDDFSISNGVVSTIEGSGSFWSINVTPNQPGSGSLDLLSDRITDLNGNANLALVSPLSFDYVDNGNPDNQLANGGFENGLAAWDTGGTVSLSGIAATGAQSVRIGRESYVVQSLALSGGSDHVFSGSLRSVNGSAIAQAGLTFWDANGVWITDEILDLAPGQDFESFDLEFTAPAGANSVSLWIYTTDGTVIVDDLELVPGGNGSGNGGGFGGPNLLANGDFEAGTASWDTGGTATPIADAFGGTLAAQLDNLSFVVQTIPVSEGDEIALEGAYFTTGSSERREIGFSFWREDGTWVTDRTLVVEEAESYSPLLVTTQVPEGTARLTVWAWNGEGNGTFVIDELVVTRNADAPENLFTNGDFESGGISPWDTGGTGVQIVAEARTGAGAARIAGDSFIVVSPATSEGETYRMSGYYTTTGPGTYREAGFSFWGGSGEWLGDSTILLDPATGYTAFSVDAEAPTGAVSVSTWIFSGAGATTTVDDLRLEQPSGN